MKNTVIIGLSEFIKPSNLFCLGHDFELPELDTRVILHNDAQMSLNGTKLKKNFDILIQSDFSQHILADMLESHERAVHYETDKRSQLIRINQIIKQVDPKGLVFTPLEMFSTGHDYHFPQPDGSISKLVIKPSNASNGEHQFIFQNTLSNLDVTLVRLYEIIRTSKTEKEMRARIEKETPAIHTNKNTFGDISDLKKAYSNPGVVMPYYYFQAEYRIIASHGVIHYGRARETENSNGYHQTKGGEILTPTNRTFIDKKTTEDFINRLYMWTDEAQGKKKEFVTIFENFFKELSKDALISADLAISTGFNNGVDNHHLPWSFKVLEYQSQFGQVGVSQQERLDIHKHYYGSLVRKFLTAKGLVK